MATGESQMRLGRQQGVMLGVKAGPRAQQSGRGQGPFLLLAVKESQQGRTDSLFSRVFQLPVAAAGLVKQSRCLFGSALIPSQQAQGAAVEAPRRRIAGEGRRTNEKSVGGPVLAEQPLRVTAQAENAAERLFQGWVLRHLGGEKPAQVYGHFSEVLGSMRLERQGAMALLYQEVEEVRSPEAFLSSNPREPYLRRTGQQVGFKLFGALPAPVRYTLKLWRPGRQVRPDLLIPDGTVTSHCAPWQAVYRPQAFSARRGQVPGDRRGGTRWSSATSCQRPCSPHPTS